MRIRTVAVGIAALAIAPVATGCSINIGDCIDFGAASAKLVAYQAAISSGELDEAEMADARAEVQEARGDVPEDVADEFGVVADAFEVFFDRIDAADADGEVTDAEWDEAAAAFDSPEVSDALDQMQVWVEDNCVPEV